ncbi:MAG: Gfo/Idh/MocA family oxidoreductase [Victivallales bacterium]|nr:Gfo/Idh/MocA family oxidoreductase [Victivallales bacterium]
MTKPSDIVNVAIVGAGGMGRGVARNLMALPDVRIIAVADPADEYADDFFYKSAVGRLPMKAEIEAKYQEADPDFVCADYIDFRVMLAEMPEIDAIVCATPDHLHAYVSVVAMRQGKHVFCEKPLAHNIWENRLMARAAKEMGVATQMGNIGHARDGMRETCEWIWDGAIGTVREVHAWAGATRWNKGMLAPPTEEPPMPEGLDWDLWLGPREPRGYHPAYHPVRWRDFWTFGLGPIGDFVCHDLDCACWALDLQAPVTVEAFSAGKSSSEMTGYGEICYFDFGAHGDRPPVKVTWYDGGLRPPTPADWPADEAIPSRGVLFIGDEGMILCPGLGVPPRLLPEARREAYTPPAPSLPRSPGHHREWIDACKGGVPAMANFTYSAQLTEIALLGAIALQTGKRFVWNAEEMKAEGVPEADALIRTPYREGWELEG